MGCYAGYTATLLKNLLAGVLSYSSFKYLKVTVLQKTKQSYLEPVQSVLYGTLARAISTSWETPLDDVGWWCGYEARGWARLRLLCTMGFRPQWSRFWRRKGGWGLPMEWGPGCCIVLVFQHWGILLLRRWGFRFCRSILGGRSWVRGKLKSLFLLAGFVFWFFIAYFLFGFKITVTYFM